MIMFSSNKKNKKELSCSLDLFSLKQVLLKKAQLQLYNADFCYELSVTYLEDFCYQDETCYLYSWSMLIWQKYIPD